MDVKTIFRRGRWRPKGWKKKATVRCLLFSQGINRAEDMMELVDGAGNECGFVENRGGPEPNRSGINMTENRSGRQGKPMGGKHGGRGKFYVSPDLG